MKSVWDNPWFSIPVLLFLNIGVAITLFLPYGDEIVRLNPWRIEPFNSFFRFFTHFGEVLPYLPAVLAALFIRYRYAILLVLGGLLTLPIGFGLKDNFGTERPARYFENQDRLSELTLVPEVDLNGGHTSFPSGHTTSAFFLFSMLTMISNEKRPRLGLLWAVMAVLVAFSRVFLVQHFLADVIGGAILGSLIGLLVWWINQRSWMQEAAWMDRGLGMRGNGIA